MPLRFHLFTVRLLFSFVLRPLKPGNKCCLIIFFSFKFFFPLMFCKMQRSTKRQCWPAAVLIGRHAQQAGGIQYRDLGEQRRCRLGHAHPHPTLAAPDNPAPGCTCTSACKSPPSVASWRKRLWLLPFLHLHPRPGNSLQHSTQNSAHGLSLSTHTHPEWQFSGGGEHPVLKVLIQFNGN